MAVEFKKVSGLRVCDTKLSCALGLMFRKARPTMLVLPKQSVRGSGIHMLFVFYPLRILWLDNKGRVVDMKEVKPFTGPHYPKKPAKYVLELPVEARFNLRSLFSA